MNPLDKVARYYVHVHNYYQHVNITSLLRTLFVKFTRFGPRNNAYILRSSHFCSIPLFPRSDCHLTT